MGTLSARGTGHGAQLCPALLSHHPLVTIVFTVISFFLPVKNIFRTGQLASFRQSQFCGNIRSITISSRHVPASLRQPCRGIDLGDSRVSELVTACEIWLSTGVVLPAVVFMASSVAGGLDGGSTVLCSLGLFQGCAVCLHSRSVLG